MTGSSTVNTGIRTGQLRPGRRHSENRVKALVLGPSYATARDLAGWPVKGGHRTTLMVMYSPVGAI